MHPPLATHTTTTTHWHAGEFILLLASYINLKLRATVTKRERQIETDGQEEQIDRQQITQCKGFKNLLYEIIF